ncbi:MAG TPA: hypothetical protein VKO61_01625 [Candidatus Paceibacterota bacterium]|nr:hypothetical protein [Candidatus Paceibacterota bacterium]
MENTITLIFQKLGTRIIEFLEHWYIRGTKVYWHFIISKFEKIDYRLAWKITLKNIFKPLYKDYSIIGHIVGFFLRSARLIVASIIYLILLIISGLIYMFWILFPIALIYRIFTG